MEHKVSIIVPVYGVEKYIEECILSMLNQTYENLEILLVDDGGKDRAPEICDRYGAKDGRIKVIHKPNGGAASARNAGLDAASGDYICFVDGDDAVDCRYVEHLLKTTLEEDADIGVCGFYIWSKTEKIVFKPEKTGTYSREDYLLRFLEDWSCSLLWNKIFRRDVIGDLRMAEGHKVDDEFFTYQVVMNARRVVVTDTPLYDYRIRRSSVMQDMGPHQERIMLDRIEYVTTRYRNIAQQMTQIEPAFFKDALDTMTRYWVHSKDMPVAQKQIRQWVKAHTGRILRLKLPLKQRLTHLYQLYIMKPTVTAEPNPLQTDPEESFD